MIFYPFYRVFYHFSYSKQIPRLARRGIVYTFDLQKTECPDSGHVKRVGLSMNIIAAQALVLRDRRDWNGPHLPWLSGRLYRKFRDRLR